MKVAICIAGFIRTWEHTKRTFLEQMKGSEIDVFVHTYKQNYYEFTAGKKDFICERCRKAEGCFYGKNFGEGIVFYSEPFFSDRDREWSDME